MFLLFGGYFSFCFSWLCIVLLNCNCLRVDYTLQIATSVVVMTVNDICEMFCFCLVLFWCQSSGKLSEPSLPIEDSQDLYNASPEPKTLFLGAGDFQFCLEDDTQSQLLDADG